MLALTPFEYGHYVKKAVVGFSGNAVYDRATQQEAETIFFDITYITDYEQKDGYVVMGIVPSKQIEVK